MRMDRPWPTIQATAYDIPDCPGAPNASAYFFCPDGTYGIYDYRDPGELRMDAVAEALITGHIKTGAIEAGPCGRGRAVSAQRAAAGLLYCRKSVFA